MELFCISLCPQLFMRQHSLAMRPQFNFSYTTVLESTQQTRPSTRHCSVPARWGTQMLHKRSLTMGPAWICWMRMGGPLCIGRGVKVASPYTSFVTLPSKMSHIDNFSWSFDFYTLVKSIHFPFKWYQNCADLPTGSKVIDNQSGYHREFHSEKLGRENSFGVQQYYSSYNLKCLKLS